MQARNSVREPVQARKALRDAGPLTPDDLAKMRATLVTELGQGAAMIETPLIGRVEFRTVDEIQAAIAWLDFAKPGDGIHAANVRGSIESWDWRLFMKNLYRDEADTVPLTMTANVVSGQLVQIGNFVGCVACDAKIGATVEVRLEGEVILPKNAADVIAQGGMCKFDPATGIVISTGTAVAGVATQAAGAGSTSVHVRLTQAGQPVALGAESAGAPKPEHAHHAR